MVLIMISIVLRLSSFLLHCVVKNNKDKEDYDYNEFLLDIQRKGSPFVKAKYLLKTLYRRNNGIIITY